MRAGAKLHHLVESCHRCSLIDKPMIKHEVYLRWLPEEVRVLAVGESPPPGQRESVFYNTSRFDRFRECMKLMARVRGDEEVLELFKTRGIFVTGAVKCRPPSKAKLEDMRKKCLLVLKEELELLKPWELVAMGRSAAFSISELLDIKLPASTVEGGTFRKGTFTVHLTPHPNYLLRFRRDLIPRLRRILFRQTWGA